jgi:RNA polymerase sigma-70 factor (ECF subfamily)
MRGQLHEPETDSSGPLRRLFDAHFEELRRFCGRLTGDSEAADDLVQAVFVRVWERRELLPLDRVTRAYLYRSARNAVISWHRGRKVVPLRLEADVADARAYGDAVLEEKQARGAVARAVDALPSRCREAFLLVREQGMSYREAADVLGVSPKTVDAHLVQAMRALRSALDAIVQPESGGEPAKSTVAGRETD